MKSKKISLILFLTSILFIATGNSLGQDTVSNVICIDSTDFDVTRNSMLIYWHIDLATAPPGYYYQRAYTFAPDSSLDTSIKPTSWDSVGNPENVTEIILYPVIYFDTIYTVGMWLRGYSLSQGPTKPAYPTDSSTAKIRIPPFGWQIVHIFPVDTVYAANQKIILIKQNDPMDITDTLWSYTYPGQLPEGFVDVGSVPFTFDPWEQQPAPFKVGLKYGNLPPGISESDLALYQVKNNELHVLYGSEVLNGAVWAIVDRDDMPFPLIVLADTIKPLITVLPYNDTIMKGNDYPTWFKTVDNVANLHWQFLYGPGHEGYSYGTSAYLSASNDTISKRVSIMDTANVINEAFGTRALIIANDGISTDTINVSRCVRSLETELFAVPKQEWTPLRTCAGLDEPSLEEIFKASIIDTIPWAYDIRYQRVFLWFNPNMTGKNYWLEYSDAVKDYFDFVPGRVIWCKTREDEVIKFGAGVTTSLKVPYEIILKPQNWTDFSNPFNFPIKLKDILIASGSAADSIEIYQWIKSGTTYTFRDLFIFAFDSVASETDTIFSNQRHDAYTVCNSFNHTVSLIIPPISLPLSDSREGNTSIQNFNTGKHRPDTLDPLIITDLPRHPDSVPIIFQTKGISNSSDNFFIQNGIITYTIKSPDITRVKFTVYNILGRKVWEKRVAGNFTGGKNTLPFINKNNPFSPASGIYLIRMNVVSRNGAQNTVTSKVMILAH